MQESKGCYSDLFDHRFLARVDRSQSPRSGASVAVVTFAPLRRYCCLLLAPGGRCCGWELVLATIIITIIYPR